MTHASGIRAVVLAGGHGLRIPPYATEFPRALVPIGEIAVIEVVISHLCAAGFDRVGVAIGHHGQLVKAYCGDGTQWGVAIEYWEETEPLGMWGAVVANLDRVAEHLLVLDGDVLSDLDYAEFLELHEKSGAPVTLATAERTHAAELKALELGGESGSVVVGWHDRPVHRYTVSMGVAAISRATLRGDAPGEPLGLEELLDRLIGTANPPLAVPYEGRWFDLGHPDDYANANDLWDPSPPDCTR